jgi:hypothetical protein
MFLEREYLLAREKDLRRWHIPPKNTMTLPNLLFTSRIQKTPWQYLCFEENTPTSYLHVGHLLFKTHENCQKLKLLFQAFQ